MFYLWWQPHWGCPWHSSLPFIFVAVRKWSPLNKFEVQGSSGSCITLLLLCLLLAEVAGRAERVGGCRGGRARGGSGTGDDEFNWEYFVFVSWVLLSCLSCSITAAVITAARERIRIHFPKWRARAVVVLMMMLCFLLLLLHPVQRGHYILSGTIVSVAGEPSQWNTKRHDGATLVGVETRFRLMFWFQYLFSVTVSDLPARFWL